MSNAAAGTRIRVSISASSAIRRAGLESIIANSSITQLVGSMYGIDALERHLRQFQPDVVVAEEAVDAGAGGGGAGGVNGNSSAAGFEGVLSRSSNDIFGNAFVSPTGGSSHGADPDGSEDSKFPLGRESHGGASGVGLGGGDIGAGSLF